MDERKLELRARILERIDLSKDLSDEEILVLIREEIVRLGQDIPLPISERKRLERKLYNSLRKLDILEDLLSDESITEIMINGPDNIFIERGGILRESGLRFSSSEKLSDVVQQIVSENNQAVNESIPIVDTRLKDGSRVNIVLPPVAVDYAIISIRKFPKEKMTMEKLVENGSISAEIADFLRTLVVSGYNLFISGSTGAGKTTLINALSDYIPKEERVITIEDSAELQLRGIRNLVRLESRNATLEGKLEITIRDLVKSALRMRPDRIIVGECRGAEALDLLQANNTGHDGSLSTGHANSNRDMISRLETMVLMGMDLPIPAIRSQIASGLDIFVHIERMSDRTRKITEVSEVDGIKDGEVNLRPIYSYDYGERTWRKENELLHREKLIRRAS